MLGSQTVAVRLVPRAGTLVNRRRCSSNKGRNPQWLQSLIPLRLTSTRARRLKIIRKKATNWKRVWRRAFQLRIHLAAHNPAPRNLKPEGDHEWSIFNGEPRIHRARC